MKPIELPPASPAVAPQRDPRRRRFLSRSSAIWFGTTLLLAGCASQTRWSITPKDGAAAPGDPMLQVSEKTNRVAVRVMTPTFANDVVTLPAFHIADDEHSAGL